VTNRNRLAAPHELRAADTEVPPAPARQLARLPIGRAVPSFHRKNAESIADADAIDLNRLPERTGGIDCDVEFKWNVRAIEVIAERGGSF
jgi:hypothetical protein